MIKDIKLELDAFQDRLFVIGNKELLWTTLLICFEIDDTSRWVTLFFSSDLIEINKSLLTFEIKFTFCFRMLKSTDR